MCVTYEVCRVTELAPSPTERSLRYNIPCSETLCQGKFNVLQNNGAQPGVKSPPPKRASTIALNWLEINYYPISTLAQNRGIGVQVSIDFTAPCPLRTLQMTSTFVAILPALDQCPCWHKIYIPYVKMTGAPPSVPNRKTESVVTQFTQTLVKDFVFLHASYSIGIA